MSLLHPERNPVPRALALGLCGVATLGGASCAKKSDPAAALATMSPHDLLLPQNAGAALRKLGGAHIGATTRFVIRAHQLPEATLPGPAPTDPDGGEAAVAAPNKPHEETLTTTLDLTMDAAGNFRFNESNDRGGRREVVLVGREMFTSIDGGRMTAGPADDAEARRLLEQAVAGPWAAWGVMARGVAASALPATRANGRSAVGFTLAKTKDPQTGPKIPPLGQWRSTITLDEARGDVLVDVASRAILHADLSASYAFQRDAELLRGEIAVRLEADSVGTVAPIVHPEATPLALRQRTILDEKALTGGLESEPLRRPGGKDDAP